jgi:hypothetical protein
MKNKEYNLKSRTSNSAWQRVEPQMVEIEADLESSALDLPIGRATNVEGRDTAACGRVGQKARSRARRVAARGRSDGGD